MRLGCSTCVVVVVFLARSWWHLHKEPLDNKCEMFHFAAISECNFHHERQTSPSWHPPAEDGGCQAHCGSAVHSHVEPPAVSLSHRQLFCYFSPNQTRINISINNHRVEKEKHQLVSCWRIFFLKKIQSVPNTSSLHRNVITFLKKWICLCQASPVLFRTRMNICELSLNTAVHKTWEPFADYKSYRNGVKKHIIFDTFR